MITPKQLHEWYLEAIKSFHPESYNPNVQKSYEELTDEQKKIDAYIAGNINKKNGFRDRYEIAGLFIGFLVIFIIGVILGYVIR